MFPVKKFLQLTMLVLVFTSGVVLGLSQGNLELTLVAAIGGILGYVISDCLRVFQLRGLTANIASILVLIYAMRNFFGTDGAAKLVCVSNLLVYLQTVLMFQEKTPRLNWQLMTLSLLQIVVAAIFNLNFEGGLFFVFYFGVVGLTMVLQTIYSNNWEIIQQNHGAAEIVGQYLRLRDALNLEHRGDETVSGRPATFFDVMRTKAFDLTNVVQHLVLWLLAALVFATILFYIIPRSGEAWFGPSVVSATGTGMTKQVDVDERGLIELSTTLVMRGWFEDETTGEYFKPRGTIYFRGLALGELTTRNGHTNWTAPYDRITPATYQKVRSARGLKNTFIQRIMLQPTNDPLLYASMPVYRHERTPIEIEFCFELEALSRRNGKDVIEKAPYSYELTTVLSNEREPLDAWPYLSDQVKIDDQPMNTHNRGQRAWLTKIDRSRYPTVTRIAAEIASRVGVENRLQLARELERHFTESGIYQYTLDFSRVPRDDSIDAVEDFLSNHKRGHCELYASALTLMLRSLDIPARLVVGFIGTEYDEDNKCFMVREADAHAWVEVYLRPSDCTKKMFTQGAAGPGGAWLRLDPTPADALANPNRGSNTIESARTLWQDYVLGLDQTKQQEDIFGASSARVLGLFDLSGWNQSFQSATEQLAKRPGLRAGLVAAVLIAMLIALFMGWLATLRKAGRKRAWKKKQSGLRRLLGGALSIISPELGKWLMGESTQGVSSWFYRRLTRDLAAVGLSRKPGQTHREFARVAAAKFNHVPDCDSIGNTISGLTELFYSVRFGAMELDQERQQQVKLMLDSLESKLSHLQPVLQDTDTSE